MSCCCNCLFDAPVFQRDCMKWRAVTKRLFFVTASRAVRPSSFTPSNVAQMPGYKPSRNVRRSVWARDGSDWKSGEVNGVFSKLA